MYYVDSCLYTSDNQRLAANTSDGRLIVWEKGDLIMPLPVQNRIKYIMSSPHWLIDAHIRIYIIHVCTLIDGVYNDGPCMIHCYTFSE